MMTREVSELITWSDKFSCGIKMIDDQHKALVALINQMFNHVTGNEKQEYDYFNKVIMEAIKYIKVHFATEEKLMLATNFPGYAEHKKAHNRFIFTVIENITDYKAGKKFILYAFTKFLKEWVLSHVALMDKQFFEHIRNLPAAMPAENQASPQQTYAESK